MIPRVNFDTVLYFVDTDCSLGVCHHLEIRQGDATTGTYPRLSACKHLVENPFVLRAGLATNVTWAVDQRVMEVPKFTMQVGPAIQPWWSIPPNLRLPLPHREAQEGPFYTNIATVASFGKQLSYRVVVRNHSGLPDPVSFVSPLYVPTMHKYEHMVTGVKLGADYVFELTVDSPQNGVWNAAVYADRYQAIDYFAGWQYTATPLVKDIKVNQTSLTAPVLYSFQLGPRSSEFTFTMARAPPGGNTVAYFTLGAAPDTGSYMKRLDFPAGLNRAELSIGNQRGGATWYVLLVPEGQTGVVFVMTDK